jgi:glycosyltransferase involved in cell wall biosynthesis
MRVIHVPFCFAPDVVGGTEIYVEALAREQQRRGVEVLVAAPAQHGERYEFNGLKVRRFGITPRIADQRVLYGAGDEIATRAFERILDEEQPDLVHLHAFTSAISAQLAHTIKQRGTDVVFTYHTPTATCARGTLMQWDEAVCDGLLRLHTCSRCVLHGLGAPKPAAFVAGSFPPSVGGVAVRLGATHGMWTAVRMTELLELQHAAMREFLGQADRVVVLCDWAGHVLMRNGIPPHKLVLSRHGLATNGGVTRGRATRVGLRVAYMGRLHHTKGVDVLLRAVRAETDLDLRLDIFGVVQDGGDYVNTLRALADGDQRIQFVDPVPAADVPRVLGGYDVLAVPSRWLETGPMVVLEAFAAGVPVLGSRLGGIAELVRDGVDGLLVAPGSIPEWAAALRRLGDEPDLVRELEAGVRPPRSMSTVAEEMLEVYQAL